MKKFLTKEQLEKLTTKRLLAYKTSIMKYPEASSWEEDNVDRMNKSNPEWKQTYSDIKDILATREHIE